MRHRKPEPERHGCDRRGERRTGQRKTRWLAGGALLLLPLLGACGGGGGAVSSTPPAPAPTPAPAPAPTPAPSAFDTSEYRRSDGAVYHGAITAWEDGATGNGVTIGIIDSGIDTDSPEFAGRIHPQSADLDGARGLEDEGGHGTAVAQVAAAARNGTGVLGIAFDASLLVLRADAPGSCASSDGCAYSNRAIAAGLDRAVTAGARVVNLSLGGSPPNLALRQAIDRATNAGVIVVVSAGNEAAIDRDNPDPLAIGLADNGNGLVIIAGSVNDQGQISDFSGRAGIKADSYLAALGERVCCEYRDGVLFVDNGGFVTLFNGTSFSAPQIAGAAALLAQAFPNLTGAEIVQLLFSSARDAGDPGDDAIYGQGILDIERAFAPQGSMSLAGTGQAMAAGDVLGTLSGAMGDGGSQGPLGIVLLDGYKRAYRTDLGGLIARSAPRHDLARALASDSRAASARLGGLALAYSIAPDAGGSGVLHPLSPTRFDDGQARLLAGHAMTRLARDTLFAFSLGEGVTALQSRLAGDADPAFLIARPAARNFGFDARPEMALALDQRLGGISVTVGAEQGDVWTPRQYGLADGDLPARYRMLSLAGSVPLGGADLMMRASMLDERASILGARFDPVLTGAGGATSLFADARIGLPLPSGWSASVAWRQGFTRMKGNDGLLRSSGFALDLSRRGIWMRDDQFGLRFAQPLRVSHGALSLSLPTGYDYASETARFTMERFSLAPSGRELAAEIVYARSLLGGELQANGWYRREPGHVAAMPADMGAAIRFRLGF
ncbi:MAG: S8 family peptidase [Blastomonas sp.]